MRYFNRDISWLGFNGKVLEEATKANVPLYERIKFLAIFSSNLDEFFRVRYPALNKFKETANDDMLQEVQRIIKMQLETFGSVLTKNILPELQDYNTYLHYGTHIPDEHASFINRFYYSRLSPFLHTTILNDSSEKVELENNELYFVVNLVDNNGNKHFAIVNIPDKPLSRFFVIPSEEGRTDIVFIDDVLHRYIDCMFPDYKVHGCYSIKLTRSADIDIVDEWSEMFEDEVLQMMQKREHGIPTRLLYDAAMPDEYVQFIQQYFELSPSDMIAGGKYHNLKDLFSLPNKIGDKVTYDLAPPCLNALIDENTSIFNSIEASDHLLHFPYHSYDNVLRFFSEAAIDPTVEEISVTLYRVASDSLITNALISAARNGKKVIAFVELKARFDESNNLNWAKKMKAAGVRIVYSIPEMKVHAKVALVKKRIGLGCKYFGLLSTGNFNERTARFYTDQVLMTMNKGITTEIDLLFAYLQSRQKPDNYSFMQFRHLMVAGFNFSERIQFLIEREIANKGQGKEAKITIKVNNLQEQTIIDLLYKASNAGVKIDLLVRGICCLVPGVTDMSEHITVRKLIGRYLEHSRIYIFHNNGNEEIYAGSADLMTRNIFRRIEVVFPIEDIRLRKQLQTFIQFQLMDDTQTSILKSDGNLVQVENNKSINAQNLMHEYVCNM